MNISEKLSNKSVEFLMLLQSIGKDKEYLYDIDGCKFHVRKNTADRFVVNEIWKKNEYDAAIRDNDIVVDIGGNIGAFAVFAAKRASKGKVFVFEPEISNYRLLEKNINLNKLKNVFSYRLGVAGKKCKIPLYLSEINKGTCSIYEAHSDEYIEIDCISLKDVFKKCKINKINLLKLDVEGAEYDILLSAPRDVFDRIDNIIFEFHDYLGLNNNYKDLIKFLKERGFKAKPCSSRLYAMFFKQGIVKAIKV